MHHHMDGGMIGVLNNETVNNGDDDDSEDEEESEEEVECQEDEGSNLSSEY